MQFHVMSRMVPHPPQPSAPQFTLSPLDQAPRSQEVEVTDLPRGRRAAHSLGQVGIRLHQKVRVLSAAPLGGPVLVDVSGTTVAIGRTLARRITVRWAGGT